MQPFLQIQLMAISTQMGLALYFFIRNVDRTWRLLENHEAGMIGMNTGKKSANRDVVLLGYPVSSCRKPVHG